MKIFSGLIRRRLSFRVPVPGACSNLNESGFTVMELLVVTSISSILLLFATPEVLGLTGSFKRSSAVQQIAFDLRRARAEAISHGARSIVAFSNSGSGYTVGIDYAPYSTDLTPDEALHASVLPDGITATSTNAIAFDSRGILIDSDGNYGYAYLMLNENGIYFSSGSVTVTGELEVY